MSRMWIIKSIINLIYMTIVAFATTLLYLIFAIIVGFIFGPLFTLVIGFFTYILGPRINAGGRVGKCSHGANLLLNSNPKEVFKLATELDLYNKERQLLEKDLLQSILNKTLIV